MTKQLGRWEKQSCTVRVGRAINIRTLQTEQGLSNGIFMTTILLYEFSLFKQQGDKYSKRVELKLLRLLIIPVL